MDNPRNDFSPWKKYFVSYAGFEKNDPWQKKLKGLLRIYSFEAKRKIKRLLDDFQPDVVHIHNIYHHISPSILSEIKKRKIPIVMTVHDYNLICPNYSLVSDGKNWAGWQVVSGTDINSSVNRYIQVRITLTSSDGMSTPKVDDWTVAYNSENLPPQNPTTVNGTSQKVGGVALASGNQYPHAHPYFTWTGAQDDGSGVDGYYVYFGTDQDADPAVDGTYHSPFRNM